MELSTDIRAGTFTKQAFLAGVQHQMQSTFAMQEVEAELTALAVEFRNSLTLKGVRIEDSGLIGRCTLWYMMGVSYNQGQVDQRYYQQRQEAGSMASRL